MYKKIFLCVIMLGMGSLSAQTFTGKINPYPSNAPLKVSLQDTIRILAVMADFQIDTDATTFGDGKFGTLYSRDYGSEIIDPLPHDRIYFENHLLFVQNYFHKVSNQKLNITYTVLPEIITVSKTMRNYSPPPRSEDLTPVAEFAREVWLKADTVYQGFNFSEYDVFFIFHAGVGRDISLPGSLGNERDLPSLYFGPNSLEELFPGSGGFPVSGGTFSITNSAIIPETESRELSSFGQTVLFELSINGLMAATLASHLGLPDLFNTETGLSAIGRFGLMDGQSIFAYNGLFPPEPSAWEKVYLGWEVPAEASLSKQDYSLIPSLLAGIGDTSILKVNLSSSEYYLIQNRQRDVNSDGAVVTFVSNNEVKTRTFIKDTTGFLSYSVDSLEGVIIDVDEYDWALPGSGILIWHIDDNIIKEKIASNSINNDPGKRGVDVEEADGIQDIGVEFQTIFGDVVIGEGEPQDLWYASNNADLYTNRFSTDTRPNTLTNSGANSLIAISDFSGISNRMSFIVSYGDTIVKPAVVLNLPYLTANVTYSRPGALLSAVTSNTNLYLMNNDGSITDSVQNFSGTKPASYNSGDTLIIAGTGTGLNLYRHQGGSVSLLQIPTGLELTSNAVIVSGQRILAGAANGTLYIFNFDRVVDSLIYPGVNEITHIAADDEYYVFTARKGDEYVLIDNARTRLQSDDTELIIDISAIDLLLTRNSRADYIAVINGENKIVAAEVNAIRTVITKENSGAGIALADLKQDGNNYIIFNDGSKLKAYSINGTPADNFPFSDPMNRGFDNYILTADFEGDNSSEIIAFTNDGRIFALDGKTGDLVRGFPLTAGSRLKTHPLLFNTTETTNLSVIDSLNNLYTWNISSIPGSLFFSEEYGSTMNTAFIPEAKGNNIIADFFPQDRVYNYPNPVYNGTTSIRYFVSENSKINIKIFDLAGALVDELNSDAAGGFDGETEWRVSGIQSGVYLARIEASSPDGNKEVNFIKIAVVK
jgi:hypothetical protein